MLASDFEVTRVVDLFRELIDVIVFRHFYEPNSNNSHILKGGNCQLKINSALGASRL